MCSRSDWMGFGVPWSSVEGIPAQGRGWNEMSFKDPSNSYCSVTLLFFFTFPAVENGYLQARSCVGNSRTRLFLEEYSCGFLCLQNLYIFRYAWKRGECSKTVTDRFLVKKKADLVTTSGRWPFLKKEKIICSMIKWPGSLAGRVYRDKRFI